MAEAMGFELMDLLQSTVFKTSTKARYFHKLLDFDFRLIFTRFIKKSYSP
jgi:hypothetical protein